MTEEQNVIFDDWRTGKKYEVSVFSGIGKRESQQDCAYVAANDSSVFAVLCDGMGGMNGGQIASHTAVEAFLEHYQYKSSEPEWMKQAVLNTDDYIYRIRDEEGKLLRAGTTLVAVTLNKNELSDIIGVSRQIYSAIETKKRNTSWNVFLSLILFFEHNEKTREMLVGIGAFP